MYVYLNKNKNIEQNYRTYGQPDNDIEIIEDENLFENVKLWLDEFNYDM